MDKKLEPIIRIRGLVKNYQQGDISVEALKGIDLDIFPGEYIGIIGKSGAGKTTLLNMIAGLDDITSGEVFVCGAAVDKMKENRKAAWRGKKIGFIFQSFQLIPGLSLLDNVMLPMDFCGTYHPKKSLEKASQLLEMVGLKDHMTKKPSEISGGQQQRVAIARSIANDPELLLADEPTGRLDSVTSDAIFDVFEQVVKNGMTLVVVSHDRSLGIRTERMIRLADGQIMEDTYSKEEKAVSA